MMTRTDFVAVIRGEYPTALRVPVYKGRDYYLYALIGDQYMKLADITKCGYKVVLE